MLSEAPTPGAAGLGETVTGAARRFPERPAVVESGGTLSWGDLDRRAGALAADMLAAGLQAGDRVGILLPSGRAWAVAAVAANRAGGAVCGISPVAAVPERAAMVDVLDPALIVCAEADGHTNSGHTDSGGTVQEVAPGPTRLRVDAGGTAVDPAPVGSPSGGWPRRDQDSPYAVCFTSGTTGAPKAAAFLDRQARAVVEIDLGAAAADDASWGTGGHMVASTQFAHVGFVLKFPWYARLGCTLHVMDRWNAGDALRLVAEHHMTTLGVVAPQLALMLRSPLLDELDVTNLRQIVAGGAASPPTLVTEAIERLGVEYSIRWSSTESGGVGLAATVTPSDHDEMGTVGLPRPGVKARVARDDGTPTPDGKVGELQVRSPAVMQGYLGDAAATAAAFTADGWLRTGDLARIDPEGRFVLAGRRSEMYVRGGYNVHPAEVEAVLGSHPGVADVAVVPRPDEVMGEVGVAVVVPVDPQRPPSLEDLRSHGAERLARHKLPEALVLVESLPLTSAAKLDRPRLADRIGGPRP